MQISAEKTKLTTNNANGIQREIKVKGQKLRQKKRWEDNIKEWTWMDFASSIRAAEYRTRLKKKIVVICGASKTLQGYEIDQTRLL